MTININLLIAHYPTNSPDAAKSVSKYLNESNNLLLSALEITKHSLHKNDRFYWQDMNI